MEWYIPITIIPAVGLLVLSTANFIIALGPEIYTLSKEDRKNRIIIREKISQISLLSKAIVSFYISIASFTLSGIAAGLVYSGGEIHEAVSTVCAGAGMLLLFLGISFLILYAIRAVRIKQMQFDVLIEEDKPR